MRTGKCEIQKKDVNKVVCDNSEVRMMNIRNRVKKQEKEEERTTM